jgi:hypothetical protein
MQLMRFGPMPSLPPRSWSSGAAPALAAIEALIWPRFLCIDGACLARESRQADERLVVSGTLT